MNVSDLREITKQIGGTVTINGKYKTKNDLIAFINKYGNNYGNKYGGGKKVEFKEDHSVFPIERYEKDTYIKNISDYAKICINHLFKKHNIWEESDITVNFPESQLSLLLACLNTINDKPLSEADKKIIMDYFNRESAILKKSRKEILKQL